MGTSIAGRAQAYKFVTWKREVGLSARGNHPLLGVHQTLDGSNQRQIYCKGLSFYKYLELIEKSAICFLDGFHQVENSALIE